MTGDTLLLTYPVEMEFVRVPAGEFLMGNTPEDITEVVDRFGGAEAWFDPEQPQHAVNLSEFYIGKHEVTNEQYAAFVRATRYGIPRDWTVVFNSVILGREDHPVERVSWEDAVAFTDWLSEETDLSFQLPTEAQWEKACRSADGRMYP